eukprot:scaffold1302_cov64-Phaeocystis_antarctica.AAC.5
MDDLQVALGAKALAGASLLEPRTTHAEVEGGEAQSTCGLLARAVSGTDGKGDGGQREQAQVGMQRLEPADVGSRRKRHDGERRQSAPCRAGVGECR